jgi:hypothetical protein
MAESIALAVLENLVHMTRQDFPRGYVCVAAALPDGISMIHEKDLRKHPALQDLGSGSVCLEGGQYCPQPPFRRLAASPAILPRRQTDPLPYQDLSTEQLGDWRLDSRTSAVPQVPSFVIAGEHNFLLNPVHSEFARIQVEPPAIFNFDERLFERS